ncbi:MAG: hypothetical protein A3H57_03045 [Candidatus Taylorbacteria bacterium RIFCSPLOWO2_02_FULL_43_11]|uniref:Uncharacterized protein n=1 Tax=Candidatus Taylorbacteria bacterium RIFCSPHIGHO2_02_FULL_43_32b TaxID=1802306 RepID=A0A1G2MIX6_9BACT|nr:MAG: hypothetical protein A2743_03140 [Candidatus Taylorbacteria bacterium RIFCSPHIGHO2_01_FULL_43_47]OHA23817.1 MAG: hypothetical protein A3C72_00870 [Candidatus Taylorbacteria bacterium RIFCSPHIGHO2_02_FULL_43_32b]OHA30679.1 MAG: hypothetical protein A3B08_02670 [Candidatus Taylorbacteria bacterium RIFCSPLOWO2_01_FULL_43_44]OHA37430.1 MAG: hypothetical protein A3H57_03045 [Candidatus Taylorbacteria bacterium RIFCSPLOWO2_02_FULL_43_11]
MPEGKNRDDSRLKCPPFGQDEVKGDSDKFESDSEEIDSNRNWSIAGYTALMVLLVVAVALFMIADYARL